MSVVYKVPSLEFCYSSLNGLQALPALKPGSPAMLGDSSPGALGLSGLWVFAATDPCLEPKTSSDSRARPSAQDQWEYPSVSAH